MKIWKMFWGDGMEKYLGKDFDEYFFIYYIFCGKGDNV